MKGVKVTKSLKLPNVRPRLRDWGHFVVIKMRGFGGFKSNMLFMIAIFKDISDIFYQSRDTFQDQNQGNF